jgi:hypothetical protein
MISDNLIKKDKTGRYFKFTDYIENPQRAKTRPNGNLMNNVEDFGKYYSNLLNSEKERHNKFWDDAN